jgi:hypothetical protein
MNQEIITAALITDKLLSAGLTAEEFDWKTPEYFRYGYWHKLPTQVWDAIKEFVEEDIYEDDDGDGPGGRPIIIRRYSYHLKK